jgi:uncharacterized membrane protein YhaH (DUF805 family)
MDYQTLFLSAQGRLNRKPYWMAAIILGVAYAVVYLLVAATREHLSFIAILLGLLSLVLAYSSICLAIKRFHDRDKSGWWVLISLIPLIGGIWYFIEVGCLAGTPGPNKYGPDPLAA